MDMKTVASTADISRCRSEVKERNLRMHPMHHFLHHPEVFKSLWGSLPDEMSCMLASYYAKPKDSIESMPFIAQLFFSHVQESSLYTLKGHKSAKTSVDFVP